MMLRGIVLFIFFISSIYGRKLHEHMTNEEIESVFNCKPDAVHKLEYEVVTILHKNNKETNGEQLESSSPTIELKAFNQDYTLYIEGNNHVLFGSNTPVYSARQGQRTRDFLDIPNIVYTREQNAFANIQAYHDVGNRAAITLHRDANNRSHVDGIIGDDIVIRSLPSRIHKEVLSEYPDLYNLSGYMPSDPFTNLPTNNNYFGNSNQQTPHIAIRQNNQANYQSGIDWIEQRNNQLNNQLNQLMNQLQNLQNQFNNLQHVTPLPPLNVNNGPSVYNQPINWNLPTLAPFNFNNGPNTYRRPSGSDPVTLPPSIVNNRQNGYNPSGNWNYPTLPPLNLNTGQNTYGQQITNRPVEPVTSLPGTNNENTVYPQLMIVIDHETYRIHGRDVQRIAKYMAAFWNAVDLRYRELQDPKVRLNIAGIVIPQEPNGTPFMERYLDRSGTIYDADRTLDAIANYFSRQNHFARNTYDVIVAMSSRTMKSGDDINGIAYGNGTCTDSGVALVYDKGGFNGITTAAHELGHSMGASHDWEVLNEWGGACPDGYLMSYHRVDVKGVHWSPCSVRDLKRFMTSNSGTCLWNKPDVGIPYRKTLPGKILTRDEQCRMSMPESSYSDKSNENCSILRCIHWGTDRLISKTLGKPPAEGSSCGEGGICLNGECVRVPQEST